MSKKHEGIKNVILIKNASLISDENNNIIMINSHTCEEIGRKIISKDIISNIIYIQRKNIILTWSIVDQFEGGKILSWETTNGKSLPSVSIPILPDGEIAVFSNDGTKILTFGGTVDDDALSTGEAFLWDSSTGKKMLPPLTHKRRIDGAIFNRDGRKILTWGSDGAARIWDSSTRKEISPALLHKREVLGAFFSDDEGKILTWDGSNAAHLWSSGTGQEIIPELQHEGISGATFSNDESKILTFGKTKLNTGTVYVFDSSTGKQMLQLAHDQEVKKAMFSDDGRKIFTWTDNGLGFWNVDENWPDKEIVLKIEVETGTVLDETTGDLNVMRVDEWRKKKCEYDKIQHQLKYITDEEWQTSENICKQLTSSNIK